MRFPNKANNFNKSNLSQFCLILNLLKAESMSVVELYEKSKLSLDDFLETTTALFALNKIDIDELKGELYYVI